MFLSPGSDLDPALLAFVKCHVTSPAKWEALRVLASHDGAWLRAEHLARMARREPREIAEAMAELIAEGVAEEMRAGASDVSYRLPPSEPTSVVLRRLIDETPRNQELRAILVASVQRARPSATRMARNVA
jgi:hypothetical protein